MKKLSMMLAGIVFSTLANASLGGESSSDIIKGYQFEGNGWQQHLDCFDGQFKQDRIPAVSFKMTEGLIEGIDHQLTQLKKELTPAQTKKHQALMTKIKTLIEFKRLIIGSGDEIHLSGFNYYRVSGEDGCGNTLLTGYFTPMMELKRKPDAAYRYPLYRKPAPEDLNKRFTRKDIDINHKLANKGLEIGYSDSLLANYLAQVQGSTYAYFIDTEETLTLAFSAKNGRAYYSLGKYMVEQGLIAKKDISLQAIESYFAQHPSQLTKLLNINPSYVFFREVNTPPMTSSNVPVVANVSVAVDPSIIPFGSVLLVEYPILDEDGKVASREFRLTIASDSGGAIKGAGHIDLYLGTDQHQAGLLHHYGRVWILQAY